MSPARGDLPADVPDDVPTDAEVAMARFVADQLAPGGRRTFEEFTDRAGRRSLDLLLCPDAEGPGVHAASTLSLHRWENLAGAGADRRDVRVELVTALPADDAGLVAGLLAASAFAALGEGTALEPGAVFRDVVADLLGGATPHLLLTLPGNLPRLQRYPLAPGADVRWLRAVPVHEAEVELLAARGLDALETLFEDREVLAHDTERAPVVP